MNEMEMDDKASMKLFFEKPEGKDIVYAYNFKRATRFTGSEEVLTIERTPVKSKALASTGNYFCFESLEQILFIAHLFKCLTEEKECICN